MAGTASSYTAPASQKIARKRTGPKSEVLITSQNYPLQLQCHYQLDFQIYWMLIGRVKSPRPRFCDIGCARERRGRRAKRGAARLSCGTGSPSSGARRDGARRWISSDRTPPRAQRQRAKGPRCAERPRDQKPLASTRDGRAARRSVCCPLGQVRRDTPSRRLRLSIAARRLRRSPQSTARIDTPRRDLPSASRHRGACCPKSHVPRRKFCRRLP